MFLAYARRTAPLGGVVLSLLLSASGVAHAAPAPAPVVAPAPAPAPGAGTDVELAKAHFRTGEIYYERGRFPDAAREFEEAYRLSQRAELLYNMGKSYDGVGDHKRALDAYRRFLAQVKTSPDRPWVTQRVEALEKIIGRVALRSNVEGATVEIDGARVGQTPLPEPVELNPGAHALVASKEGWKSFRQEVVVAPGVETRVDARLDSLVQVKIVEVERKGPKKPLYKQWWLWTVVGVVAAGAAAGIAVAATREQPIDGPYLKLPSVQ